MFKIKYDIFVLDSVGPFGDVPKNFQDYLNTKVNSNMDTSTDDSDKSITDDLYNIDNDYLIKLNSIRRKLNMVEITDDDDFTSKSSPSNKTDSPKTSSLPPAESSIKTNTLSQGSSTALSDHSLDILSRDPTSTSPRLVEITDSVERKNQGTEIGQKVNLESLRESHIKEQGDTKVLQRRVTSFTSENVISLPKYSPRLSLTVDPTPKNDNFDVNYLSQGKRETKQDDKEVQFCNTDNQTKQESKFVNTSRSIQTLTKIDSALKSNIVEMCSKKLEENLDKITERLIEKANIAFSDYQSADYVPPKKKVCVEDSKEEVSHEELNGTQPTSDVNHTAAHFLTNQTTSTSGGSERFDMSRKNLKKNRAKRNEDIIEKVSSSDEDEPQPYFNFKFKSSKKVLKKMDEERIQMGKWLYSRYLSDMKNQGETSGIRPGINQVGATQTFMEENCSNTCRKKISTTKHIYPEVHIRTAENSQKNFSVNERSSVRDSVSARDRNERIENLYFNPNQSDNSSQSSSNNVYTVNTCVELHRTVPNTILESQTISKVPYNVITLEKTPVLERKKSSAMSESSFARNKQYFIHYENKGDVNRFVEDKMDIISQNDKTFQNTKVGLDGPKKVSMANNFPQISNAATLVGHVSDKDSLKKFVLHDNEEMMYKYKCEGSMTSNSDSALNSKPPKLLRKTTIHRENSKNDLCVLTSGGHREVEIGMNTYNSDTAISKHSRRTIKDYLDDATTVSCSNICLCFKSCFR